MTLSHNLGSYLECIRKPTTGQYKVAKRKQKFEHNNAKVSAATKN